MEAVAVTASTMQRVAIFLVCLLSSALALPTPARLWSKGNGPIIGGSSANIANYQWQLSFQYGGGASSTSVSGSLLGTSARVVTLASDNYDPPGGLAVTVTGWGATYTDGLSISSMLNVNISILDRNTCRNTFANINTVTDRMVCAGQAGKSVCNGDSGGPLVSGSTQVGIISWGSSSCEATPGVFANVGNLRSWIRSASGV
ncbi:trypsin alpha-3-like [Schistocerca nitens]|uniref:trypsin alpha-3-like n=1 Tax=Schistocerca nitens TaxID=7011 RepID=UPI002117E3EE|nr:trypsin alpha-3-like [Schistocerca nitens]